MKIQYIKTGEIYEIDFVKQIYDNIVQINGDFPIQEYGFMLSEDGKAWNGDYSKYRTIYRLIDGGAQFSNNGNVYTGGDEPEPSIPTYEQILNNKIDELSAQCQSAIVSGLDIDGVHYSYGEKDQINFDKMENTLTKTGLPLGYHADDGDCAEYTAEQIISISIQLQRNKYCQQTYFNQTRRYLRDLEESDENKELVANYVYGTPLEGEYLETYDYLVGLFDAQIEALSGMN